jgi:hypothetical protein
MGKGKKGRGQSTLALAFILTSSHMADRRQRHPGARFVDPTVLARIGKSICSADGRDGFINGLHRAPYFGASIDFAEHRGYVPGDDIRRVDWRLYARTDKYFVKQYEADTNTNFSVLLDVSKSMGFTSGGVSKLEYSCFLAAFWPTGAPAAGPRRPHHVRRRHRQLRAGIAASTSSCTLTERSRSARQPGHPDHQDGRALQRQARARLDFYEEPT